MTRRTSRNRRRIGTPSSDQRQQIVIFTEGQKTEVSYFEYWAKLNKETVNVDISTQHGVPWSLVRWAAETRRQDRKFGRTRTNNTEYWCVFDRNSHLKIPDAIQMARDNDIHVAMSNPCIELWFLLHYEDHAAHTGRREAQRRSSQLLTWHKKALPSDVLERLADRYEEARNRAWRLDERHRGDGRPPRSNPSSDVWRLVDRIRGL